MPSKIPKENPRHRIKQPSEVLTGAKVKAPVLRNGEVYSQETLDWWLTWINSPQAEAFLDTDWERLQMLAALVNAYWKKPTAGSLAEIRQNEALLGATVQDRQKLRMKDASGKFVQGDNNPKDEPEPTITDDDLYQLMNGG